MIALVFDTPERLWWSFVLLIPLGLHLWRRRHFQPKSWAAMQFVLQAWQEESQKAKLQNLLLVLLRVAVLALFLFAISAPSTGVRRPIVGDESTGTHHIVIIDSTYSMATIDQKSGKSALAEAKQKAIDYVRELPNGDVVSVLTIGEFEQWIVEIPGNDFQQVAAAINEITVQSAGGNLQDVLELSAELIKRYREQDPNLLNAHLVVFTDMERNVWETIIGSEDPTVSSRSTLSDLGTLNVVDCRVEPMANSAITGLAIQYDQGAFAADVTVVAELACYYHQTSNTVGISWFLDDEFVLRTETEIGAGETASVELPLKNLDTGSHHIEARLDDDSLALDNSRWLAFDSPARLRVLCVDGAEDASAAVSLAFAPTDLPDWPVFTLTINEVEFEQYHLEDYDVIALCELDVISAFNIRRLRSFVNQGGTLIVAPGQALDLESYNSFYGGSQNGLEAGLQWGNFIANEPTEDTESSIHVTGHDIGLLFRSHPNNGISALPIYKYVEIEVIENHESETVLELSNGAPLLVCSPIGKGHVLTFSTSLAIETDEQRWSDLGAWPSFLPLIHESMRYVLEQRIRTANVNIGEFPERRISMNNGPVTISVQGPDGETQEYFMEFSRDPDSGEVYAYWWHREFKKPGVYYVNYRSAGQVVNSSLVVGNLAVTESDHDLLEVGVIDEVVSGIENSLGGSGLASTSEQRGLFREMLCLTLLLMTLETFWLTRQHSGNLRGGRRR